MFNFADALNALHIDQIIIIIMIFLMIILEIEILLKMIDYQSRF